MKLKELLEINILLYTRFLNLGPVDILGQITILGGCPVHHRVLAASLASTP